MVKLSNDIVREQTMRSFLTKTRLDLTNVEIHSIEGLYAFSFTGADNSSGFAKRLKAALDPNIQLKVIKLDDLIADEFSKATCDGPKRAETHKKSCQGVWAVVKSSVSFTFSSESGMLEISLPDPAYAPLLNLLKYPHLKFTAEGKLLLDINALLKDTPEGIVRLNGIDKQQMPVIFLNPKALESKKIFYTTQEVENNQVEVTPHFFVPQQVEPPKYHFVLDVSSSMGSDIEGLKKSAGELATLLFDYQPEATLSLTIFSQGIHDKGTFKKGSLENLLSVIGEITILGDTPLNQVTANFLERIKTERAQNNVLLFTDGEDSRSDISELSRARSLIAELQDDPITAARTKFYVFAYRVEANCLGLMKEVVDLFKSELVDTSSADFMNAQTDPESMKKWAAPRDLFKSRVEISNAGNKQSNTYSMALDLSGQLIPLDSTVCRPGDQVSVTVTNGDDVVVASGNQKAPYPTLSNAKAISNLGINAANKPAAAAPMTSSNSMQY